MDLMEEGKNHTTIPVEPEQFTKEPGTKRAFLHSPA